MCNFLNSLHNKVPHKQALPWALPQSCLHTVSSCDFSKSCLFTQMRSKIQLTHPRGLSRQGRCMSSCHQRPSSPSKGKVCGSFLSSLTPGRSYRKVHMESSGCGMGVTGVRNLCCSYCGVCSASPLTKATSEPLCPSLF